MTIEAHDAVGVDFRFEKWVDAVTGNGITNTNPLTFTSGSINTENIKAYYRIEN